MLIPLIIRNFTSYIWSVNQKKYRYIIYIIAITAFITVLTQIYRSWQNYELNKERFVQEMQLILDLSVEAYFADLARKDILILEEAMLSDTTTHLSIGNWVISDSINGNGRKRKLITSQEYVKDSVYGFQSFSSTLRLDSLFSNLDPRMIKSIKVSSDIQSSDLDRLDSSLNNEVRLSFSESSENIKVFAKKLMFSLSQSTLDFEKLEEYVEAEMQRRGLSVDHLLSLYQSPPKSQIAQFRSDKKEKRNLEFFQIADTTYSRSIIGKELPFEVFSKGTYLASNQKLSIRFGNASLNILKRGGLDLIISLVIIMVVIGSLLYLYKIITEQKQLAEIKNDFISNITHEFKTPIATISTAMEGILNFNQANDPEKTVKYLDISKGQLKKLNGMVEKLLETASLDSNEIDISEDEVEVVTFTKQIFDKFHLIKGDKTLSFETAMSEEWVKMDEFHMENSLGNLVDNAIKYGGDDIKVRLSANHESIFWEVIDNGGKINKLDRVRIFDKFYRVPTGNVHDVKGFGIGLYYTKTLVEKHGGSVDLKVTPNSTNFSIQLPKKNA